MIYWTLPDGIILRVETQNWDFIPNGDGIFAKPFSSKQIVGSNLFQFISSPEVAHVYRALATRVFESGRTINFAYRCDSRAMRRDMTMQLSRDAAMVRYESTLVGESAREEEIPLDTPGTEAFVAICSFCKNYRFPVESNVWKDLERLLLEVDLPTQFSLSHSICSVCYETLMKIELSQVPSSCGVLLPANSPSNSHS